MTTEIRSQIYIGSLVALAGLLGAAAVWLWPLTLQVTDRIWLIPVLTALVALVGRFPFKVSPQGDATLITLPLFMAVLLLHPLEAGFVAVVGTLIAEKWLGAPDKVATFNISVSAIVAVSAGMVFWGFHPAGAGLLFTPGVVLAAMAAGLVVHILDLGLLFGMITLVKGKNFWQRWSESWAFEAVLEGSLLILGLIGAQLMMFAWWWLALLAAPFVVAYYGFKHSVNEATAKTRLAEELEQNLTELKETQSQLIHSAKLATVGTLAAGVAHEINNPLMIITGRAELLLARLQKSGGELDIEKITSDIKDMYSMGMRISTITNQLLAYSRRTDHLADVSLDTIMGDALTMLERKIEQKGVTLVQEIQRTSTVNAVASQLQQVFVNLISNALDATPAWGTITVGCTEQGGAVTAYVSDTGVGIPEDIQDKIFEPFFTTKEVGKGTGLGLFLCQKIVVDHGGELSLESEQGAGTTFYVKIPLLEVVADDVDEFVSLTAASAS